jgi:hypothetical protein
MWPWAAAGGIGAHDGVNAVLMCPFTAPHGRHASDDGEDVEEDQQPTQGKNIRTAPVLREREREVTAERSPAPY